MFKLEGIQKTVTRKVGRLERKIVIRTCLFSISEKNGRGNRPFAKLKMDCHMVYTEEGTEYGLKTV